MKKYYYFAIKICILTFIFHADIAAQSSVCMGSFGDNIFKDGDFGSGSLNVPEKPDELISAYVYVWQAPPPDGYYLFTNNTGAWDFLYPTWLPIGDNSEDEKGYFMVVNGDTFPGLFYERVIDNLCEQTDYSFSIDIINMQKSSASDKVMPNISFLIDGEQKLNTGNVQQNERWRTYGFNFTTGEGVTSVRLSLKNETLVGDGNDFALDNIQLKACGPEAALFPKDTVKTCVGEDVVDLQLIDLSGQINFMQWQESVDGGLNWMNIEHETSTNFQHFNRIPQSYNYRYIAANTIANLANPNCRINSDQAVIEVSLPVHEVQQDICEGQSLQIGNSIYTQTGIYTDSLLSSIGCDSILITHLNVLPKKTIAFELDYQHPSCWGAADGWIQLSDIQNGDVPYHITINEGLLTEDLKLENIPSGVYEIMIQDTASCSEKTNVELIDPARFELDLGQDLSIQLGEEVTLTASSNQAIKQYIWETAIEGVCAYCEQIRFRPKQSQYYYLTAVSEENCSSQDSIFIHVDSDQTIFIPNAFSPNEDDVNEHLSIFAIANSVKEVTYFRVFDRWGNLVFEQTQIPPTQMSDIWDGRVGNKPLRAGTYIYTCQIVFIDDSKELLSGEINLIKD